MFNRNIAFNKKCLIANSRQYLATANVVIYVIRLNLCFLKPALYFISDKAGGSKSNFADRNLTSAKGYPCQYKVLNAGWIYFITQYCIVLSYTK